MINPDIIVTACMSMDFPLWRKLMEEQRHAFSSIYNVFYNDNRIWDFSPFIKQHTDHFITSLDCTYDYSAADWRDSCVNLALEHSANEWVLFTEQDFYPHDAVTFYANVFDRAEEFDVIGFVDERGDKPWQFGVRLHPAFLLVRRSLIDQTTKNFANNEGFAPDHFGRFCDELLAQAPRFASLESLGELPGEDWTHWQGVVSNYFLVDQDQPPNFQPAEFQRYVELCLDPTIMQDPQFLVWSKRCLQACKEITQEST